MSENARAKIIEILMKLADTLNTKKRFLEPILWEKPLTKTECEVCVYIENIENIENKEMSNE